MTASQASDLNIISLIQMVSNQVQGLFFKV